jgi:hypothetical protein
VKRTPPHHGRRAAGGAPLQRADLVDVDKPGAEAAVQAQDPAGDACRERLHRTTP